ncbi:MAG: hypothetical protein AB1641_10215 [Thermodesulfobacteriota bacterium]
MSMLMFLPWCPIDKSYEVGEIIISPFNRLEELAKLNNSDHVIVNTFFNTYRDISGEPINKAAIVGYKGKSWLDELEDGEFEEAYELVALACFCSLAKREYFTSGPYSNSDCFQMYVHRFKSRDFTAIRMKRRNGITLSGWSVNKIKLSIPIHCHSIHKVSIDDNLLQSLIEYRSSRDSKWRYWQNAILCFNQANTDSDRFRYQVEWVLLSSAIEHVLGAKPKSKDVAKEFVKVMVPNKPIPVNQSSRRSNQWTKEDQSLRYEWMKEFYSIRGDFAHGKLISQKPSQWSPLEHLVLASIAFPLVVKILLSKDGKYNLTIDDQAQINCFEKLADTSSFLDHPSDARSSLESYWNRCIWKFKEDQQIKNAVQLLNKFRENTE